MRRFLIGLLVAGLSAVPTQAQNSNILDTGAITANSSGSACTAVPQGCAIFQVGNSVIQSVTLQVSGTYVGTLGAFEATSSDNPVTGTWFAITGIDLSTGASATAVAANGTGQFSFQNSGLTYIRVRATAWTSGTAVVTAVRGYASARWLTPFFASLTLSSSGTLAWSSRTKCSSPSDGVLLCTNNAGTDFSRLQFGGTTSSFPALVRNSSSLDVKLADNSAYATLNTGNINVSNGAEIRANGKAYIIATAPTIASGFGTTPSIVASNGTAAFTINVGTGGTASSGVLTMTAATTGWACQVENVTGVAANRANQRTLQTATTTTSVTIQNQTISTGAALAWTASDVIRAMCLAY